jgi:hypothetical protein
VKLRRRSRVSRSLSPGRPLWAGPVGSPRLRRRKDKGSGTPRDAWLNDPHPCGARQRSFGSARLSAFHRGSRPRDYSSQRLSVRPCFLGLGRSVRSCTAASTGRRRPRASPRALPAPEKKRPIPVQRSTSHTGHSAGRMMPKPPGNEADEASRAGTALAPPAAVTRPASFTMSERARFYYPRGWSQGFFHKNDLCLI